MRPTPKELAEGVRTMLRAAGSELQSERAKAQMRRAMYVLKGARWDDAAFDVMHENELLRSALEVFGSAAVQAGLLPPAATPRSFAEANARNRALRTALAAALDALRETALPDTAAARRALALQFLERP